MCLRSYSKTQATIAQSSAESELIAVVRAACEGLGMISLADDFGIELKIRLHVDAAAALGILQRQGGFTSSNSGGSSNSPRSWAPGTQRI